MRKIEKEKNWEGIEECSHAGWYMCERDWAAGEERVRFEFSSVIYSSVLTQSQSSKRLVTHTVIWDKNVSGSQGSLSKWG